MSPVIVGKDSIASMLVMLIVGWAEMYIPSEPLILERENPGSFVVQLTSSPIEPFGQ